MICRAALSGGCGDAGVVYKRYEHGRSIDATSAFWQNFQDVQRIVFIRRF
jgi:hypothetical protein